MVDQRTIAGLCLAGLTALLAAGAAPSRADADDALRKGSIPARPDSDLARRAPADTRRLSPSFGAALPAIPPCTAARCRPKSGSVGSHAVGLAAAVGTVLWVRRRPASPAS